MAQAGLWGGPHQCDHCHPPGAPDQEFKNHTFRRNDIYHGALPRSQVKTSRYCRVDVAQKGMKVDKLTRMD